MADDRVFINTDRQITDHLLSRVSGSMYDVYYRAIEEWSTINVTNATFRLINNLFIRLADDAALSAWDFYYTDRPFDMSVNTWRQLLLFLNEMSAEGPTLENVSRLLRFFDPVATFSTVQGTPIYSLNPPVGAYPTGYPGTTAYEGTALTATHTSLLWDKSVTPDTFPTEEYVIQGTATEFNPYADNFTEFILFNKSAVVYQTSLLTIPLPSHRVLLRTLLDLLLPANVCFIVRILTTDTPILYATTFLRTARGSWPSDKVYLINSLTTWDGIPLSVGTAPMTSVYNIIPYHGGSGVVAAAYGLDNVGTSGAIDIQKVTPPMLFVIDNSNPTPVKLDTSMQLPNSFGTIKGAFGPDNILLSDSNNKVLYKINIKTGATRTAVLTQETSIATYTPPGVAGTWNNVIQHTAQGKALFNESALWIFRTVSTLVPRLQGEYIFPSAIGTAAKFYDVYDNNLNLIQSYPASTLALNQYANPGMVSMWFMEELFPITQTQSFAKYKVIPGYSTGAIVSIDLVNGIAANDYVVSSLTPDSPAIPGTSVTSAILLRDNTLLVQSLNVVTRMTYFTKVTFNNPNPVQLYSEQNPYARDYKMILCGEDLILVDPFNNTFRRWADIYNGGTTISAPAPIPGNVDGYIALVETGTKDGILLI